MSSPQISFLLCKIQTVMPLGGIIVHVKCPPEGNPHLLHVCLVPSAAGYLERIVSFEGILPSFSAGRNRRVERMCDMSKIPHMRRGRALIASHIFLIPSPVLSLPPRHQGLPTGAKQGCAFSSCFPEGGRCHLLAKREREST